MSEMLLNLPDHVDLESRAAAAGFSCVDEYIRDLIERDIDQLNGQRIAEEEETKRVGRLIPREQWTRELQSLLDLCKVSNPDFDDSRESIYPVR